MADEDRAHEEMQDESGPDGQAPPIAKILADIVVALAVIVAARNNRTALFALIPLAFVIAYDIWLVARLLDTPGRRRATALHLDEIVERSPDNPAAPPAALLAAAFAGRRFERCYAMRLLEQFPSSVTAMTAMGSGLESADPYVRHSAAAALYCVGTAARSQMPQLERISRQRSTETAGRIASAALRRLSDKDSTVAPTSPEG